MLLKMMHYIQEKLGNCRYDGAFILGSGLSYLGMDMDIEQKINTCDIPTYPHSTVEGHSGMILKVSIYGKKILIFSGRVHYYEGYTSEEIVKSIDICKILDIKDLIITNAAGGIRFDLDPGNIVLITDYIDNISSSSYQIKPCASNYLDTRLASIIKKASLQIKINLKEGVYAGVTGPTFETPAEISYLRNAGADIVGMSTVLEIKRAIEEQINVAALSFVSNYAAGITDQELSHQEVSEAGIAIKPKFTGLVKEIIRNV